MDKTNNPLDLFHPYIHKWFLERVGPPTDIQWRAWPEISYGTHVLITSPTGTGKTLTAFLWAINQLITGTWPSGHTRILYISPMKALNNDVRRNLLKPLEELKEYFKNEGADFPPVNVMTRSGDTPYDERRRMLRRPPEILITTPESLNIILSSANSRLMLTGIATVIMDEIHSVFDSKRGTHLITAIDRLTEICGEFQRIALSATVKPVETVADFTGGFMLEGDAEPYRYRKRKVSVIRSEDKKQYEIKICFPENAGESLIDESMWPVLVTAFKEIIRQNKSTLLFANSRRLTEKIARMINEGEQETLAYSHHGSLSREIRLAVEQRLKNGELKAIIATNSLELGIDIGDLDTVVLIQSPPSVSSALQRIGRSGHSVGDVSRGLIFPAHGHDFIEAAVIARSVVDRDIESQSPVEGPLDVLAQIIISMTGVEKRDIDQLYAFIKASYPYRNLPRKQFDLVVEMLAGRFAGTMLRELRSRVYIDRIENTIHAKEGMLRLIYLSGGTIPDRGYFDLRVQESGAKIGELDEEFVWERREGETFTLGTQTWRIQRITHNDVEVVPVEAKPGIYPFWKAEELDRDFHFSENISVFLEYANTNLNNPDFKNELMNRYFMEDSAAESLISYLQLQISATGAALPHRHHVLIEHFDDPMNKYDRKQVILHTLWGGRVNRPFALSLASAWEEKYHYTLEVMVNNDCIILILPHEFEANDIFNMVTPENLEHFLRLKLEKTGFFGGRFRENAGRALLLPKADFKRRLPLWLNRLRSKKLLDSIMKLEDFPILLETWRACIKDEFDMDHTRQVLDEILTGKIFISEAYTHKASPFADSLIWKQTNTFMYMDDTPDSRARSNLSQELLKEVILSSSLRPRLSGDLIKNFEDKIRRTAPGYSPRSEEDLLDWTRERLVIPMNEWDDLLYAMTRDNNEDSRRMAESISGKISILQLPGSSIDSICALENIPRILSSLKLTAEMININPVLKSNSPENKLNGSFKKIFQRSNFKHDTEATPSEFLTQWLSFYGPVKKQFIKSTLGINEAGLNDVLGSLAEEQSIIIDRLREGSEEEEICDYDNLEILLRMARRARQPQFRALDLDYLPLFCASFQGLNRRNSSDSMDDLKNCLDQLFGFPASPAAWEEYILPARMEIYYSSWLDSLMQSSDLVWFGCGNKRVSFSFSDDLELFNDTSSKSRLPDSARRKSDEVAAMVPASGMSGETVALTPASGMSGETAALTPASGMSDETAALTPANRMSGEVDALIPDINGRYSFFDILNYSRMTSGIVTEKLWRLTWKGIISNDSFSSLRKGILNNFAPVDSRHEIGLTRRSGINRWSSTRPISGNWYVLARPEEKDALENEEMIKDRVRQLFKRYGIIFRELITGEQNIMQWGRIFRTLRLMELSGEIFSGYFFKDIPGVQFISNEAYRFINDPLQENSIFWMNAADPASVCGTKLEGIKSKLPSRLSSTYLVFHGKEPVLVTKRNHKILEFKVKPDNQYIGEYLSFLKVFPARDFNPMNIISVNIINDKPALKSEYAEALIKFGFRKQYRGLELVKKY